MFPRRLRRNHLPLERTRQESCLSVPWHQFRGDVHGIVIRLAGHQLGKQFFIFRPAHVGILHLDARIPLVEFLENLRHVLFLQAAGNADTTLLLGQFTDLIEGLAKARRGGGGGALRFGDDPTPHQC